MLKLGTCQIGLKRLKRGNDFSAFKIENEEELTEKDVIILVNEDDVIEKDEGLFKVLNKKPIEILRY